MPMKVWGIRKKDDGGWLMENDRKPTMHSLRRKATDDLAEVFGPVHCQGKKVLPDRTDEWEVAEFTPKDALRFRQDYGFWPWREDGSNPNTPRED